jgi:hypothetical protein
MAGMRQAGALPGMMPNAAYAGLHAAQARMASNAEAQALDSVVDSDIGGCRGVCNVYNGFKRRGARRRERVGAGAPSVGVWLSERSVRM